MNTKSENPYDYMPDWQVWLCTIVFRWFPLGSKVLSIIVAVATIIWIVVSPFNWAISLKFGIGSLVAWGLWRLALFSHSICVDFYTAFYQLYEERMREKDERGYFLFLRSFSDDAFAIRSTIKIAPGNEGRTTVVATENLSEQLERGLARYGRIMMIGNEYSADPFRDASLMVKTDDANWWSVFCRLIEHARCIFVVPEASVGLGRELKETLNGPHRTKMIVVMQREDSEGQRASRWAEIRSVLERRGLELPRYNPIGCFYMPNTRLGTEKVFPFSQSHSVISAMDHAFRDIDGRIGPGKVSLKEALTWVTLAGGKFS